MAILLHGLEGNAQRVYMTGHGKVLIENNWDVAALNYRGCSGEENKLYPSYHSGKTHDVISLINFILEKDLYQEIILVGFSLGGNLVLKYLGEGNKVPKEIKKGIAISSPLYLYGSLKALELWGNWVYHTAFLLDLRAKYKRKMAYFPDKMNLLELKKIRSLFDFDTIYTAPAHGFEDAMDYYEKNSSLQFLPRIKTPVLILNALNDSFLSEKCYPFSLSEKSKNIYLEAPKHGGHVAFHQTNTTYYSERRMIEFLNQL